MTDTGPTVPGYHYRRARHRTSELLADLDLEGWNTPTEACPGWRVRDVLAHLVGIIEDVDAGVLTGPPDEDQTAAQVDRHRDHDPRDLLEAWAQRAPAFEDAISAISMWPAAIDAVTHEHDIRTALDRPGARDDESVVLLAGRAAELLVAPSTITFLLDDGAHVSRPADGPPLRVAMSSFELLRARLGRRSREQVAALAWDGDADAVLGEFFVMGPRTDPLVE